MTRILLFVAILSASFTLFSCTSHSEKSGDNSPKFQQYYVQGQVLYQKYCSNCHQPNGKGLGRLYPPLDQSDFMDRNFEEVVCVVKYGSQDRLAVNGVEYNMAMKGIPGLTELEVAEIITYIYNTWSHQKGLVDVTEVAQLLSACNN